MLGLARSVAELELRICRLQEKVKNMQEDLKNCMYYFEIVKKEIIDNEERRLVKIPPRQEEVIIKEGYSPSLGSSMPSLPVAGVPITEILLPIPPGLPDT